MGIVRGPLLTDATSIVTPDCPVVTVKSQFRKLSAILSIVGSASRPGTTSTHDGRRPFFVAPTNMNWLTMNTEAPTPTALSSSSRIRSSAILRAAVSRASAASVQPTPTGAKTAPVSPPSTWPTTEPSTVTGVDLIRVRMAFIYCLSSKNSMGGVKP